MARGCLVKIHRKANTEAKRMTLVDGREISALRVDSLRMLKYIERQERRQTCSWPYFSSRKQGRI